MISHLNGILEQKEADHVVVDVGRVGYHVTLPAAAFSRLPQIGQEIKLYTVQVVREDDISLYGFLTREERSLFKILLKVNGVGPKVAITIVGAFSLDKLVTAITKGNIDLLSSIPGIGKKTAQKIVLELKEKVGKAFGGVGEAAGGEFELKGESREVGDAVAALVALGYLVREARSLIAKLDPAVLAGKTEEIVKQALSRTSR
jgi:Holliday junction DNA helicase RuvA